MTANLTLEEHQRQQVSLYLLRERALNDFNTKFPQINRISIADGNDLNGFFYPIPSKQEPPEWMTRIRPLLPRDIQIDNLLGQHPAAILYIFQKEKHLVFTFGHAWSSLSDDWVDQSFGKRVALNTIPREKLSELKMEQVFAGWHIASERSPAPSNISRFGVEAERDLVHAIEGHPSAAEANILGTSIRGGVSLRMKIDFGNLKNTLDLVLNLEKKKDYQSVWPELDNLTVVTEPEIREKLDNQLDLLLQDPKKVKDILLVAPSLKNGDIPAPSWFWIGRLSTPKKGSSRPLNPYLSVETWLTRLNKKNLTSSLEAACNTPVHLFDENDKEIGGTTIYSCIGFETSHLKPTETVATTYVLSAGSWYEASSNFVTQIDQEINTLPDLAPNPLCTWDGCVSEGQYNSHCAKEKELYLFDAKSIYFGGGKSQFEFCDLYDEKTKTLFFVKHIDKSNHFSHLSEQVRRTIELVFGPDNKFRAKLVEKIKEHHPQMDRTWLEGNRPAVSDFTLCLVSMGRHYRDFPFFAKCGLARLLKELNRRNHRVTFLTV